MIRNLSVLVTLVTLVCLARGGLATLCVPDITTLRLSTTVVHVEWDCQLGDDGVFHVRLTNEATGTRHESPILPSGTRKFSIGNLVTGNQYEVSVKAIGDWNSETFVWDGASRTYDLVAGVDVHSHSESDFDPFPTGVATFVFPGQAVVGDPHVETFDGRTVTYLGAGDFMVMENPTTGFAYHARYCLRGQAAGTCTCAVAVRCSRDAEVVEVLTTEHDGAVVVRVKGADVTVEEGSVLHRAGVNVSRVDAGTLRIQCPVGVTGSDFALTARIQEAATHKYLDTAVRLPEAWFRQLQGLAGVWDGVPDNDVSFRDGRVSDAAAGQTYLNAVDYPQLDEVQQSWMVRADETMFSVAATTAKWSAAARRRFIAGVAQTSLRGMADAACAGAGLDAVWLNACVFDFMATGGDAQFAANTAAMTRRTEEPDLEVW